MTKLKTKFMNNFQTIHGDDYNNSWFSIKSITIISRLSSFVLGIDKESLEHVALQSVQASEYGNVCNFLKELTIPENEYFLLLKNELLTEENDPIVWITYENCFCFLENYISLTKYSGDSPGKYFANETFNGWLDQLYSKEFNLFPFNTKSVAVNIIHQLFLLIDYLKEQNLSQFFSITSILITCQGKVKLFPGGDDNNKHNTTKDPEDVLINLQQNEVELLEKLEFEHDIQYDKNITNVHYLRNLFATALISIRILFKDWSPFRVSDLNEKIIKRFNIDNEQIWFVRCVYEDDIYQNFITDGILNALTDQNSDLRELLTLLVLLFQSRSERSYVSNHSKFLIELNTNKENIEQCLSSDNNSLFLAFLQQHYESQISENQHNQSWDESHGSPSKKMKSNSNGCQSSTCGNDACSNDEYNKFSKGSFSGLENWMEDSKSFFEQTPTCGNEESEIEDDIIDETLVGCSGQSDTVEEPYVPNEYKGIENWMEDSISFIQPAVPHTNRGFKTSTPINKIPPGNNVFTESELETTQECNAVHDNDNSMVSLTFDLPEVDDENFTNEMFPIFKTNNNGKYLKYMSKKSKEARLLFRDPSKPIITCYPAGYCDMQFDLNSETEMYLKRIPIKYLKEDLESQTCGSNVANIIHNDEDTNSSAMQGVTLDLQLSEFSDAT